MSGSGTESSGVAGSDEGVVEDVDGVGACEAAVRLQRSRAPTPARTPRCIGLTIQMGMLRAGRVIVRTRSASLSRAAAEPMNSTHAQAAGKSGDECCQHCKSDQHNDQQGEAREQRRGCGLQDRTDDSDECVEKNHLGDRTRKSRCVLARSDQLWSSGLFVECASSSGSGSVATVKPTAASQCSTVDRDSRDERDE